MNIYLDKKTIDKLMDKKSFRFYSDLLKAIARELGEKELDDFATREKANFSKMLKKQRTLNYNYIIPLERIFGVSTLVLSGQHGYEIPDGPKDIPYLKTFRYFAYKDDPSLYDELERMTTAEGDPILHERDEYAREFIDYVIEYGAINGVRYLVERHDLHYDPIHRELSMDGHFRYTPEQTRRLAVMLAEKKESELFMTVYDPISCLTDPYRSGTDSLFSDEDLLDAILSDEKVLKTTLSKRMVPFSTINPGIEPVDGTKDDIVFANPMAIALLGRAKNSEKQKTILAYMSEHNRYTESSLRYPLDEYSVDRDGFVRIQHAVYGNVFLPDGGLAGLYRPSIKLGRKETHD